MQMANPLTYKFVDHQGIAALTMQFGKELQDVHRFPNHPVANILGILTVITECMSNRRNQ